MKEIKWEDIDVICLVEYCGAWINFKTYEVTGHVEGKLGLYDIPLFEKKINKEDEDDDGGHDTENIEEAQEYISGTIKWDACSHVYFGDEGYIHVCGGRNWKHLIETQRRLFKLADDYFQKPHERDEFEDFYK